MISVVALLLLQCLAGTKAAPMPQGASTSPAGAEFYETTALVGVNGRTVPQCWRFNNPFLETEEAGLEGSKILALGQASSAAFVRTEPSFDGGLHTAPAKQWVGFLSGLSCVTFPDSDEVVWVEGGTKDSLVFAADTADVSQLGHTTIYPDPTRETIGIGVRTAGGAIPPHTVLSGYENRPCDKHRRNPSIKCEVRGNTGSRN